MPEYRKPTKAEAVERFWQVLAEQLALNEPRSIAQEQEPKGLWDDASRRVYAVDRAMRELRRAARDLAAADSICLLGSYADKIRKDVDQLTRDVRDVKRSLHSLNPHPPHGVRR